MRREDALQDIRQDHHEAFSSIYRVDLTTGEYNAIRRSQVYCAHIPLAGTWDDFVRLYVDVSVYDEDKTLFQDAVDLEHLKAQFAQGHRLVSVEFRCIARGVEDTWCRGTAIVTDEDESGKAERFIFTLGDITAEKRQAEHLADIQRMKDIHDFAISGVNLFLWELNLETDEITFGDNPFTLKRKKEIGYPDVVPHASRYIMNNVMPESVSTMQRIFDDIRDGKPFTSGDIHYRAGGDRGYTVCRVSYRVMCDESGKPVRAYGSEQNITDQVMLRDTYAAELRRFETAGSDDLLMRIHANMTKNALIASEPDLFGIMQEGTYDDILTRDYFMRTIMSDGRRLKNVLSRGHIIERYAAGDRHIELSYRWPGQETWRWIRAEINAVQNPASSDIELFLYARDVSREYLESMIVERLTNVIYDDVCVINVTDGSYMLQSGEGIVESDETRAYKARVDSFLATRIREADRAAVAPLFRLDNIRKVLAQDKVDTIRTTETEDDGTLSYKVRQYTWLDDDESLLLMSVSDVTKETRRELALEAETERLRRLHNAFVEGLNAVHDAEIMLDLDENVYYLFQISKTFTPEDAQGSIDEIRQMYIQSFPEDSSYRENFSRILDTGYMRASLAGGKVYETDYRRDLADGSHKWFSFHMTAVMREADEPVRYVMICTTDITDTVNAQSALRRDLEETNKNLNREMALLRSFRNIYDQSLYIETATGKITLIEVPEMFRHLVEEADYQIQVSSELVAERLFQSEYQEGIRMFMELSTLDERLAESDVDTYECLGVDDRWYRGYMIPVTRDDTGHVTYVIFAVQDIDREKRKLDALNAQIASDTAILSQTSIDAYDFIAIIDLSDRMISLRSGSWFNANVPTPHKMRMLPYKNLIAYIAQNYTVDEEAGKEFVRSFAIENIIEELGEDNVVYHPFDFLDGEKRETLRYKQFRFNWLDETHERILVSRADVTVTMEKEKKMNVQMRDALSAAEAANSAKSDFLSRMSHDIRTPMNAIIGFSTLLLKNADDPEKVADQSRKILTSSNHLLGLINDILDMSKIETGKVKMNVHRFSLADSLSIIDSIMRPQMDAKHQSFDLYVSGLRHTYFVADDQRLQQVLLNVLSNATKYTDEGGRIVMRVTSLPESSGTYESIRFEVEDNGRGMTDAYQKVIFEPFSREQLKTHEAAQGTGLGMAITKNLVNLMGGTISVKSVLGEGSTFTIVVPMHLPGEEEDHAFWKSHDLTKMLVVDDEEEVCLNIMETMSGTGVHMDYALSGQEALTMLESAHDAMDDYNLVLLDWKMPGMDGLETARRIRETLPPEVLIIILTAYDYSAIEDKAKDAGIDGFLPKPFFLEGFANTVRSRVLNAEESAPMDHDALLDVFAGMHILAAEDNDLNAEILVDILDMEDADVDVREDGLLTLETFKDAPVGTYDLILMDIQMPVMDGYEATRAIRALALSESLSAEKRAEARDIPIVAMTANAFSDDVQNALAAGMNAHVAKPLDLSVLARTVSDLSGKKAS